MLCKNFNNKCIWIQNERPVFIELESARKQAEMDKKAIDDLVRERDILNKNMLKAGAATQKQQNLVKLHEQSKKTLEQEIQNYKEEVCKLQYQLYQYWVE